MVSSNEEHWNSYEEFDSYEEAVEFALNDFAADYGIEPGRHVYVGQVREITNEMIASRVCSAEQVLEDVGEYLYELVGDEVTHPFDTNVAQRVDLDFHLEQAFLEWARKHRLQAGCFTLDHVSSHVVERDFEAEEESKQVALDADRMTREAP